MYIYILLYRKDYYFPKTAQWVEHLVIFIYIFIYILYIYTYVYIYIYIYILNKFIKQKN